MKPQPLSAIDVSDPSLFRGGGNLKPSVRRERSFGLAAVGVVGARVRIGCISRVD